MHNKFVIGKEYKTTKRNLEVGVRTFKVEKISRKNKAIMLSGAINGVFRLNTNEDGYEFIDIGFNRNYLNPFATDIIE